MQDAYSILIKKLRAFTRKYYQNLLIRGLILSFSSSSLGFITLALFEYYGRFGVEVRTVLFWGVVVLFTLIAFFWVLTPLLKLAKLKEGINEDQAAKIIGKHFPDVSDKLLNTLQLKKQKKENLTLLEASINQKATQLKPVPFLRAVSFSENKRIIKYAFIPLLVFVGLYAADKEELLTDSASRIIDYKTEYTPPPPFDFIILNKKLESIQHQDYKLRVQLEGKNIPKEAYIDLGGLLIKMKRDKESVFEYYFRNLQKTKNFNLSAAGVYSSKHTLNVLPAPSVINFELKLNYPDYTGKNDEVFENKGEVLAPEGTAARWEFFTENTEGFDILWNEKQIKTVRESFGLFSFSKKVKTTASYSLLPFNTKVPTIDTVKYSFKIIKDGYPVVDVAEVVDSTNLKVRYFKGQIKDDYGINKLQFVIRKQHSGIDSIVPIKVNKDLSTQNFFFVFDLTPLEIKQGESIEYYFEVHDNDEVNGSKKSQSKRFDFSPPSEEELKKQQAKKTDELKRQLEENVQLAQNLQEEFKELQKKLLNKEELSWEDKQQVKDVLDKQKRLEKNIEQISQKNKEKNAMMNDFSEQDRRVLEKQKQLQSLMDELMTEEMKELFKEMEKLIEEMKTDDWMEKFEEFKISNEDLEKELDRNLEMLKKYEFEQGLQEGIEKLKELKAKQEGIKKDNDEKTKSQTRISEEQEKLKQEFQKLSEEIDDLHKMNEDLERKENLKETGELQGLIEQEMKESEEELKNNKRKKASQAQEKTINNMEKLLEKLEEAQNASSDTSPPEDMNALRQILENLIDLSLEEEEILRSLSQTNKDDPEYVSLIHWQNKLGDDSKILEDSLFALSKRQTQIKATINREMNAITNNIEKALNNMAERHSDKALTKQQLVMTSANNLALMLSDVLQAMQEDLANKTPGEQQCDKPGSGPPSPSDLKKMQKQLKKQMEKMKKGGQDGKKTRPEGKELVKMMARQEMIRQQLEKMAQQIEEGEGGKNEGLREAIQKMEQTEEDIINDNITQETINRQNQIIEHLLDAEKAENEREKEKKRESKEAQQLPYQAQELLEEYQRNKIKQAEQLKTIPPKLTPYYKDKVKDYFQKRNE